MGDFATLTVEWDAWEHDSDERRCTGIAEVAGNTATVTITVVERIGSLPTVTARWSNGSQVKDDAVLRVATRLGMAHAEEISQGHTHTVASSHVGRGAIIETCACGASREVEHGGTRAWSTDWS
jgi:hypothetical protein